MSQCELCGCTAFTKTDDYYVCQQCGSRYTKNQLNVENLLSQNSRKNSSGGIYILITIIILAIIVVPQLDRFGLNIDDIKDSIATVTKKEPTVRIEATLSGYDIHIICNDSYNLVEVEVTAYDKNKNIVDKETLQGKNYKKGSTYKLQYTPSIGVILKTDNFIQVA